MRFNYSFCIAFLLLAHMSTAVPLTGVDNGEEFTGNKILPSSLEKTSEAKPENAVKSETLRSKRGYDYSDYSSESSEEYFGYFNKPHHYHFNTHWPNNPYHRLPPTPPTEAYVFWRPASSRSPYYHGKYHNHQHDKKYLSKSRKRRNTISIDDVDDQENDTVFPSRPLFVSKGQTSFKEAINVRPLRPVAVPLSVGTINSPKRQEEKPSHALDDKSTQSLIASSISYEYHDQAPVESFTKQRGDYQPSYSTSYNSKYSSPIPSTFRHHYPPPPPPPPYGHYYPPPPPHYHYPPPPPHHHQYYPPPPPPPPHSFHYYYPPPPPPPPHPYYFPYPSSDSSQHYVKPEYTQHTPSSVSNYESRNDCHDDNSMKCGNFNEKVQEIFGSSTTEENYDVPSLVDIRIKKIVRSH